MKIFAVFLACCVAVAICEKRKISSQKFWRESFGDVQKAHVGLLEKAAKILDGANSTWWLTCGNLLGYVRHGKRFIPWDDDVDICVMDDENWQNFRNSLPSGWSLTEKFYGWDLSHEDFPNSKIDIFLQTFETSEIISGTPQSQKEWPMEYWIREELFPLYRGVWEGIKLWLPREPEAFLRRAYGPEWKIPQLTKIHHGNFFRKALVLFTKPKIE